MKNKFFDSFACLSLLLHTACLWPPSLDESGYVTCEDDRFCRAPLYCIEQRCSDPPWAESIAQERIALVQEESSGNAAHIFRLRVGGSQADLSLDQFRNGVRFMNYLSQENRWEDAPMHVENYPDRLIVWGQSLEDHATRLDTSRTLSYLYIGDLSTVTTAPPFRRLVNRFADDSGTFEDRYLLLDSAGQDIVTTSAQLTLQQGQQLYLKDPIPSEAIIHIRFSINGINCARIYIGLTGALGQGTRQPVAGLYIGPQFTTAFEWSPLRNSSAIRDIDSGKILDTPNQEKRLRLIRSQGQVDIEIDDSIFYRSQQEEPLSSEDLFFTTELNGACSIEIREIWWAQGSDIRQELYPAVQRF